MSPLLNGVKMFGDLIENISDCSSCPLRRTANRVVVGGGNLDADIMLLGEAPGKDEDKTGIPFVGKAGQLLFETLSDVGITRDDIYITNVVKCRPPGNRNPSKDEIRACERNTISLLNRIKPVLVVGVGAFATNYLLRDHGVIYKDAVGKVFTTEDYAIYSIRHPAYALHKRTESVMSEVQKYIRKISSVYDIIKDKY